MARTLEAPVDLGTESAFLAHTEENQGLHLMFVTAAYEDQKETKDGLKPFDGIAFVCECVGGVNDGKRFNIELIDGKATHADEGKSARSKQMAMLIATDVLKPQDLGKQVSYETSSSEGSIFVVDLVLGKVGDNGKRYLNVNYTNIFHIDDPRAKKLKLDKDQQKKIDSIPKEFRHDEKYFESLTAKKAPHKKADAVKADFSDL